MIKIFLVTIFIVNGEPSLVKGFHPLQVSDMETCKKNAVILRNYLSVKDNPLNPGYPFKVFCTVQRST